MSLTRIAVICLLSTATAACIEPPLPEETLDAQIELDPGESVLVEFEAVVTSEVGGVVQVTMMPTSATLEARGVEARTSANVDEKALDVWPNTLDLDAEVTRVIDFAVELTNTGSDQQSVDLRVRVGVASYGVPEPFPDEVSISLRRR